MKKAPFILFFVLAGLFAAYGQETKPSEPQDTQAQPAQQEDRNAFLREIGLAPDQIRQIRRLNMDRKPFMEAAQTRLREANRLLDESIYSDEVNDADLQLRLKEAQAAQADLFRLRSMNELAIRKILTPDQLVRFRDLRKQFEAARLEQRKQRQMENGMKPNGRFPRNAARPFARPNQQRQQGLPPQKQP